ncbi:uncharacterized protein LOC105686168 isoform X2 [Athalia rosae]|uniref:uncharacterized protein LOC105686168 isoform X2 n=1 Tax=Athalia rosae TaxID=37344 RepID=UPI000626E01D|nr:uncharacterized protein LOC105686168 isoform X2 [Athalia rosae]
MVATASGTVQTLFDFTRGPDQAGSWSEHSDTVRSSGMSKAVMVMQKTQLFQRAILFTLFNPQTNGSGFASVRCETNFDLSEFSNITIRCRGQGVNIKYKMLLRHKGLGKDSAVYGQIFSAPEKEFATVRLPLAEFKPYHRGRELPLETNPLDIAAITNVALKVDNGQYLPDNHPGVAALEIDWIKATKSSSATN